MRKVPALVPFYRQEFGASFQRSTEAHGAGEYRRWEPALWMEAEAGGDGAELCDTGSQALNQEPLCPGKQAGGGSEPFPWTILSPSILPRAIKEYFFISLLEIDHPSCPLAE